jgi:hypothetical protein
VSRIIEEIEVTVATGVAYDQWTQFGEPTGAWRGRIDDGDVEDDAAGMADDDRPRDASSVGPSS